MVWSQRQGLFVVGQRFLVPAERGKHIAAIAARIEVTWSQYQRPLIACERVGVAAEILERQAFVVVSGGVGGPRRQDLLEGGERLLVAFERVEDDAIVGECIRRSG